jgi:hypothetical protein
VIFLFFCDFHVIYEFAILPEREKNKKKEMCQHLGHGSAQFTGAKGPRGGLQPSSREPNLS